jgi:predicted transcriptional regulator
MLTVETMRKIRLARHRDGKPIGQIAREFNHSKNTVKKVLRSETTVFRYERNSQPRPTLGPFVESLEARLQEDQKLPKSLFALAALRSVPQAGSQLIRARCAPLSPASGFPVSRS